MNVVRRYTVVSDKVDLIKIYWDDIDRLVEYRKEEEDKNKKQNKSLTGLDGKIQKAK